MGVIDLIYAILGRFVQFPQGKEDELQGKAFSWQMRETERLKVVGNEPLKKKDLDKLDSKDKVLAQILWYNQQWYSQTLCAILFLPLCRYVAEYVGETMKIANNEVTQDID